MVPGGRLHGCVSESTPSSRDHHGPTSVPITGYGSLLPGIRWIPGTLSEIPPALTRHWGPCRVGMAIWSRDRQKGFARMGLSRAGSWVGVGVGYHMCSCSSAAVFQRSPSVPVVYMPFAEKGHCTHTSLASLRHIGLKTKVFQRCCVPHSPW